MSEVKVDINQLKELRGITGISYSECRSALIEANNKIDKALEILKIRGLTKAQSKLNNFVKEGITKVLVDKNVAVIGELNCQTDFVANNLEFNNLLNQILVTILKYRPKTIQEVMTCHISKNETIQELIMRAISKLGENIVLTKFQIVEKQNNEIFGHYVHTGGVSAGLVVLADTNNQQVATDVTMQLVAMNPKYIDINDIDPEIITKETEIAKQQTKDINKPAEIIEKMINGRVNKALAELTITSQAFIKDPSMTIKQYLEKNNAKIRFMIRYKVGE